MKRFERKVPRVVELRDRVAARPNIKAYLASDRRIPFNEDDIFRAATRRLTRRASNRPLYRSYIAGRVAVSNSYG